MSPFPRRAPDGTRVLMPDRAEGGRVELASLLMLFLVSASPAQGQSGDALTGQIVDAGTNSGINAATVELVGEGWRLTSDTGTYRFEDLEPGEYRLRVASMGYAPETRVVLVAGATVADFQLRIAPLELDSLAVLVRLIDVQGRVRDAADGFYIVSATVVSGNGTVEETNRRGRFQMDSVPEGVPLPVRVEAFGYLPLSIVMIPEREGTYDFQLEEDPIIRRLIDAQVSRLEERVGMRWSPLMPPMNRDDLLRYADEATMWDVLLAEHRQWLDKVKCVVLDEHVVGERAGPIHNSLWVARSAMRGLLPEEVERIEVMAYGGRLQGLVLRVYTRAFMQRLIAGDAQLVANPLGHDINCR